MEEHVHHTVTTETSDSSMSSVILILLLVGLIVFLAIYFYPRQERIRIIETPSLRGEPNEVLPTVPAPTPTLGT